MKDAEVAFKILNRRNSLSPIIMIGELQEAIGQLGYETAMNRGWVVPNYDSGELSVTDAQEKLDEMSQLAKDHQGIQEVKVPINNIYGQFATHAPRMSIVEAFVTPTLDYGVGDEVVVAEDGQPLKAIIKAKNPDGSFQLSFGATKPKVSRPSYKQEELKKTAAGPAQAKPGSPPPATSGTPPVSSIH